MWKLPTDARTASDALTALRQQAVSQLGQEVAGLTDQAAHAKPTARRLIRFAVATELVAARQDRGFASFERRGADHLETALRRIHRDTALHHALRCIVEDHGQDTHAHAWRQRLTAVAPHAGPPRLDRNGLADGRVYRLVQALAEARTRAKIWPGDNQDTGLAPALAPGLAALYRKARAAGAAVVKADHPTPRQWDALARATARVAQALRWIEARWPEGFKPERKAFDKLAKHAEALALAPALRAAIADKRFQQHAQRHDAALAPEALRLMHGLLADTPAQWSGRIQRRLDPTLASPPNARRVVASTPATDAEPAAQAA
ncbi:MAG: hypothetical protein AAF612_10520 [Planctomycetota bacterium]